MSTKSFYLEIKSDPSTLPEVEEFFDNIFAQIDIEKSRVNDLVLSVNEATTNGMMHGNKGDINKKVRISVTVDDERIRVSIKDEGRGFDPSKVPDPTAPENIFKENGRGLFIMKTCMDEMTYNFTPEGTELILSMKLK